MRQKPAQILALCFIVWTMIVSAAHAENKTKITPEMINSSKEATAVAIDFKGDAEQVFFPTPDVFILADRKGTVNISWTLSAYDCTTGEIIWTKEIPVGRRDLVLERQVWIDESGGTLFIGNGPLTAIDVQTGSVIWALEYDKTGLVCDVLLGENRVLVQGTKKPGFTIVVAIGDNAVENIMARLNAIRRHLENPKLICLDRKTGTILWQHEYDPPKDNGLAALGTSHLENGCYDLDGGMTGIQGKHLYGISNADARPLWELKDKTESRSAFSDKYLYANVDGKVRAVDLATGNRIWESSTKTDKKADLVLDADRVIAIYAGEYNPEEDAFKGDYKIAILSASSGDAINAEIKGSDLQEYPSVKEGRLSICDKKGLHVYDPESGKLLLNVARADLYSYDFATGDYFITLDKKDIGCWKQGSSEPEFLLTLDRSENEAKPVVMKMLDGGYSAAYNIEAGNCVKSKSASGKPIWINTRSKLAPVGLIGTTLIWPSRKNGLVGFSIPEGTIAWHLPTGKDPLPFFSSRGDMIVVRDGKKLLLMRF